MLNQLLSRLSSNLSTGALVLGAASLAACSEPDGEIAYDLQAAEAAVSMGVPSVIAQARAVDPSALELEVSIGNRTVAMSRVDGTSRWTGTLNVAPGQYNVQARWFETIEGRADRLVLGSTSDLVSMVGTRPARLSLGSQNFDTSFDVDLDGWFNLHERQIESDPFEINSPGSAPPISTMTLALNLPERLQNEALDVGSLTATAFVNALGVPLNRQGNQWVGTANVAIDARAFIRVDWYQDSSTQVLFGRSQQAFNASLNTVYTPTPESYRWDYDANSNGQSNLDEALVGN